MEITLEQSAEAINLRLYGESDWDLWQPAEFVQYPLSQHFGAPLHPHPRCAKQNCFERLECITVVTHLGGVVVMTLDLAVLLLLLLLLRLAWMLVLGLQVLRLLCARLCIAAASGVAGSAGAALSPVVHHCSA